jgi:hypothetical protein
MLIIFLKLIISNKKTTSKSPSSLIMIDPSFLPTDREVSCHGLVPLHLKMRRRRQRLPLATPKSVQALIVQGITSIVIVIASLSIVSAISIDEDCGGIDSSISSGSNIQVRIKSNMIFTVSPQCCIVRLVIHFEIEGKTNRKNPIQYKDHLEMKSYLSLLKYVS